jgi:hypothetical protein
MSDKYKIRKENGLYVVYKNGKPVKSFPTFEEAEKYVKEQEQKEERKPPIKKR